MAKKDGKRKQTPGVRPQTALPLFRNKERTSPSRQETSPQVRAWIGSSRGWSGLWVEVLGDAGQGLQFLQPSRLHGLVTCSDPPEDLISWLLL